MAPGGRNRRAQRGEAADGTDSATETEPDPRRHERRYAWAELLKRVFAVDVLECDRCGGRMRLIAAIHPPETTGAILGHLGLPTAALPNAPPRPDPEFDALDLRA